MALLVRTHESGAALGVTRRTRKHLRERPPTPPERPPGDGGGGGGSNDKDGEFAPAGDPEGIGPFALGLTLVGITTLFVVVIVAWWILRRGTLAAERTWPPALLEPLALSTILLLGSGVAVEFAARRERLGASGRRASRRWLTTALGCGAAFLLAQLQLWLGLSRAGFVPASSGLAAGFFALTGLHALHVLGGLGFLGSLAVRLRRARDRVPSVRLGAVYWHFMGGLWLVLLGILRAIG